MIVVDKRSATPVHRQVYDAWRRAILAGLVRRGERLPSTRELANTLAVSRSTVSHAYEQLTAEGYLQAAQGAGTFVCAELPDDLVPASAASPATAATPAIRLSRFGVRLEDDFAYPPQPSDHICFSRWGPDIDQFPFALWRRLLMRTMRNPRHEHFDYARRAQGFACLREEIAAYVARSRAVRCTPEQVIVVNGSQQALDLAARLLLEPGDEVTFENPGYAGTRRVFEAYGLRLRPARIDAEGIVPGDLGKRSRLVYVTPSHQFPTGVAMSLARRLELIAWARERNAVIIEDDYDSEYRYSGAPLPSLQGLTTDVPVVYCGTFSKVMFPALRIGWVVVPRSLVAPFTRAKWLADRHSPMLEQVALADFLGEGHLDRHVRRMRRLYGHRRQVLVDALEQTFGSRASVRGDAAGMHLLVRLDDPGVLARAVRNKVQLVRAETYYLAGGPPNEYVFGFSTLHDRTIRQGVKRLID